MRILGVDFEDYTVTTNKITGVTSMYVMGSGTLECNGLQDEFRFKYDDHLDDFKVEGYTINSNVFSIAEMDEVQEFLDDLTVEELIRFYNG